MIPPTTVAYIIISAVKMQVIKQQSFHPFVVFILLGSLPDYCMIFFMYYFIALYIKSPVAIGSHQVERFIGFNGQYFTAPAYGGVPYRTVNADLIRRDVPYQLFRIIFTISGQY